MLTVTTINVNGLRAAAKKGFLEWLAATPADVVCLQEVRAADGERPDVPGWHTVYAESAVKGRNGVAVYSRTEPSATRTGFGAAEFEDSGRYVEAWFPGLVVASVYLPSGEVGTARQDEKERFLAAFHTYLVELRDKAAAGGCEVLVCGDWNIAHQEIDLKAWKTNRKNAGFTPQERDWLSSVLSAETGYRDVLRLLHPEGPGPYTWWSYRGKAFDNDSGWRIDLVVGTAAISATAVSAVVERPASYAERWSDHAPMTATFAWPTNG
ncbi:exodeoxyribonuclease III [Actinokineospora sp. NBRC 105648]|uniref:exodeoxyribonuclease III n=1 Tax=Actinokineospora sp. NBRC 105648 TaxID=3032206 RepID=UPI0024A19BEF|nr:exodeoxyribonuclease III [Actinokineospora sp. NBRC 105648]GLZ42468.1 exodeoxyribonuclease III [Actinokineospora sp. NBRC 105648]